MIVWDIRVETCMDRHLRAETTSYNFCENPLTSQRIPLHQKGIGMTFTQSISTCFSKYATFSGRASRSEYWWFALFGMIVNLVANRIDGVGSRSFELNVGALDLSVGTTGSLISLVIFVPSLAVMVRRFHDIDKSGWWFWIVLVPFVGWIIFIVWMASEGTQGPNTYGNPPTTEPDSPHDPEPPVEPEYTVEERESPIPDVREDREPTIRRL